MTERSKPVAMAQEMMMDFAEETGLTSSRKVPRRYLWTDAFAVCNFLELYRQTKDQKYKHLALDLVDQVHRTLGRHREDDPRIGWISGLDDEEGKRHPTKGGLRIGKEMKERKRDEPLDEQLEWDRDGQYYHYLTKWMHALHQISRVTGEAIYNRWAMELAQTAHARFTYGPAGHKRMYWKMSIDLSYPLVPAMGQHDPLDGFITYLQLQEAADQAPETPMGLSLKAEIEDMAHLCEGKDWTTDDPLGLGGLLADAFRVAQLTLAGHFHQSHLVETLLDSAPLGLRSYERQHPLRQPTEYRLAFRELGLTIGLKAAERMQRLVGKDPGFSKLLPRTESLLRYKSIGEKIEMFWLDEANREVISWTEHGDINSVMLVTSLIPDGFLTLR